MLKATIYVSLIVTTLMLTATEAVAEDEIYRWVDENGVVHFSERSGDNKDAVQVKVRKSSKSGIGNNQPPSTTAVEPDTDADQAEEEEPSYAQQRRNERVERRQQAAKQRAEMEKTCGLARQRVATLEPSPRVMIQNEDGSTTRLDDEQRLELLEEAKDFIADNCNS